VKRLVAMLAISLAACQAQSAPGPPASSTGSPAPYADRIYVQEGSGQRMLELDWSGKIVGSVAAVGFGTASPDGSKFIRSGDHPSIEDWRGHSLGSLDSQLVTYGFPTWAEDNLHLCGIAFPASVGSDAGQGSLWVLTPGNKAHIIGPVGMAGSQPAVQACSISNNTVVVAAGASPHWPPGATRYLITTEVAAFNLSTGAVEYQRVYPQGNMGGQLDATPDKHADWVLVTPSSDGRYLAESGVFSHMTTIREIASDKPVATFPGSVTGFSSDDSRVVVEMTAADVPAEVRVMTWQDQRIIWHYPVTSAGVMARPNSSDLLIETPRPNGNSDLFAVTKTGAVTIAANVLPPSVCPCYPGA
jgi:hypothetical protein